MDNIKRTNGIDYLARLERFRHIDEEREELIKDLVTKYQNLEQRFEQKWRSLDPLATFPGISIPLRSAVRRAVRFTATSQSLMRVRYK